MGLALARLISLAVEVWIWLILIRAVLSWFRPQAGAWYYDLLHLLERATEPVLAPIRRRLPWGPVDFSPLVAILLLELARQVLVRLVLTAFG